MDCVNIGGFGATDPKEFEKWQAEGAFSIASWEPSAVYDQPAEWDASQGSSLGDAEFLDLAAFRGSLTGQEEQVFEGSYDAPATGYSIHDPCPDRYSFGADYSLEGTISGTISPRTISSSADDNFRHEDVWPQFRLFAGVPSDMPPEASVAFSPTKTSLPMSNTLILDDVTGVSHSGGYVDYQSHHVMNYSEIPQPQFGIDSWADIAPTTTCAEEPIHAPEVPAVPAEPQGQRQETPSQEPRELMQPLEGRWLESLETQLPTDLTTIPFASLPQQSLFVSGDEQSVQDISQPASGSSSVSGDFPAADQSCPVDTHPSGGHVKSEFLGSDTQCGQWEGSTSDDDSPEESQSFPSITAFVVRENSSNSSTVAVPTRSRASSSAAHKTSNRHMPLSAQSGAAVKKRKSRCTAVSLDLSQPMPLQIVQEDGQGGSIASADFVSPPRGARRKGPLTTVGRANAGLRRKNKDTCVQCRLNKRKCDGASPCDACRPTLHEQPCARACFSSIVEYGTCNYISQRAINHPTMDGSSRVRMEIPSAFDMNDLLELLSERHGRFDIRTSQAWGSLYVLDLGEMYKFLKGLSECNGNSRCTFLELIDRRLVESKDKSKNWISCVKDCDPTTNAYALLSQWNNMPSRARYSFVPKSSLSSSSSSSTGQGQAERPMDVTNSDDQREILLAAQLSRIVCRMLEIDGFRKLERDFYNIKWKQISHDTHVRFLNELGHILLTLRWRVSWWKRLGDGGRDPDPNQQHYVDRVELLCRILYVYYTCVLAKLPAWSSSSSAAANDVTKGVWSKYPDSENAVWDEFPFDPTDDGFHNWLERGQDLIEQAGVPGMVSRGG